MSLPAIIAKIPDYAHDIKKNFEELFTKQVEGLSDAQVYGIALACCYSLKNDYLLHNFKRVAQLYIEDNYSEATRIAAILMAMNNTYYNFANEFDDADIHSMPSDLAMTKLTEHGINKTDFEMFITAISILNKCKYCMNLHGKRLLKHGVSKIALKNIGRIAAILKGTSEALEIQKIRSYDLSAGQPSMQ
ncbi:MAG: carboxymuconolactone decarboxylase family protein [Rickettsiales bacterium]